jgi:predicted TIM-barrel fold metal-dependent hydrolase
VDKVVLLAMDGVYTDGVYNDERTHFMVSNECVRRIAADHPDDVLWGASVNPVRADAVGVLEDCLTWEPPPALLKWIPNSQEFHPYCDVPDAFYECLRREGLPLLCHTGVEHAVHVERRPIDYQTYGNPRNLCKALDMGVTVIAAHCATRYFPWDAYDGLHELAEMMALAQTGKPHWRLYADVSAMCNLTRAGIIDDVLEAIPGERMVLGSDYPVPVDDMPQVMRATDPADEQSSVWSMSNAIDKNHAQLLAMGFPQEIGTRAGSLLNPAALAWTPG